MPEFTYHTKQSAPADSQDWLPDGFIPNLHAVMAESPQLLAGYKSIWELLSKSSLSPLHQQVVMMTANFENNCHYCVPWHSYLMAQEKMPENIINALRDNTPTDDKQIEALRTLTRALLDNRGHAGDKATQNFLDAGFTNQNLLDVVLALAVKLMSNYTNAITHTTLDELPKKDWDWSKPVNV
ncbi:hypothetical protein KS4_35870 [Poriferisphaera corsica]|uniref:Carboxymuconolactone decarboxylase n=1 Tax=Poriferisphaera corsica TaxID=2528020 RepID=A0A517YZ50_9BACT|nr:carboxymuconolactone decarboxylase family protein [Poriferisphaera corsica]QDU35504.1 hypothetical protein KS4_35870 [Poriferisphaera corsica]